MGQMRNIALCLRYIGTRYHGWQAQRGLETVSSAVDRALSRVCGESVRAAGCGRTDAGVHARMYCASFRSSCTVPADRLPYAVNAYLPRDIAVTDARDVPDDFHAIYSCVKKEYAYEIKVSRIRDPFDIDRAYYYRQPLDLSRMRDAARHLVGTHDFAAMRSLGTPTRTTTRTVHWYEIDERDGGATLRVCADGFLYNMARAMAGTLLYVSEGKLAPDDIPGLLASRERAGAGPTVPPQGLYLNRIWYNSTDMFAL